MSKKDKKQEEIIDNGLIEIIQPRGGITFKEPNYILMGDGYTRCLHLYALPTSLNDYWLDKVFLLPNSICSIDISTKNIGEVKRNINKSLTEESVRKFTAKDYMELYDAEKRQAQLQTLYNEIDSMGEVIKLCDFRIFVKAKTLKKLEERCEEIIKNLESDSFRTTTFLNEGKSEWVSLYEPYAKTHLEPFAMKGLTLTSSQIAMGYPFDYCELLDDTGDLMGFTQTGGCVVYDEFTKSSKRKHYNSVVCGDMGSGKSTYLKKRFKANASKGNFVRTFDISGEFTNLTYEYGGKIIKCNGDQGMLNPLEILKSGEDDYTSYSNHISKMQAFFKCVIPSMDDHLLQDLANSLRGFYGDFNLIPSDVNVITGLESSAYPTMSMFREYLNEYLQYIINEDKKAETDVQTNLNIVEANSINTILKAVSNLCDNYGNMFDGHTTISNITNEKIVTFDISTIKDLGNVFAAQMQNLVSLCWDNAITNGEIAKKEWEETGNDTDITKFLILIDESHRWVNTNMPLILNMIISYMREARKYFAGITLASQSIRDFMPAIKESNAMEIEKIKMLFELSQYKVMFKQDSSAKEHIRNIFGDEMTFSQVEQIPVLGQGNCVLCISGDRSFRYKVWLSPDYEDKLFSGGR